MLNSGNKSLRLFVSPFPHLWSDAQIHCKALAKSQAFWSWNPELRTNLSDTQQWWFYLGRCALFQDLCLPLHKLFSICRSSTVWPCQSSGHLWTYFIFFSPCSEELWSKSVRNYLLPCKLRHSIIKILARCPPVLATEPQTDPKSLLPSLSSHLSHKTILLLVCLQRHLYNMSTEVCPLRRLHFHPQQLHLVLS